MSEQSRAPGWYPDPSGPPGAQRWWNGISWGDQTRWAGPGQFPTAGPAPYGPPPSPARRRSPVTWIVSGCLVLVLLFLGGVGAVVLIVVRATSGPREAVTAYFDDLEQGRYSAAAGRLCARYAELGELTLRDAYPDLVDADVTSVSANGDSASVTVELTTGSASAYPVRVAAVREGGEWKVCSIGS